MVDYRFLEEIVLLRIENKTKASLVHAAPAQIDVRDNKGSCLLEVSMQLQVVPQRRRATCSNFSCNVVAL